MALKRNSSGKLLRNSSGKLVNECAPDECCPYPWPDPDGTPLYPDTDLSATVTLVLPDTSTVTLTRDSGLYSFTSADFVWNVTADPVIPSWTLVNTDTGSEYYFGSGFFWASPCLIGSYEPDDPGAGAPTLTIEDPFSNTYLVDLGGGDTGTVTRVPATNLCRWTGTSTGAVPILLEYNSTTFQFEVNGVAKDSDNSAPDAGDGNYGSYNVS